MKLKVNARGEIEPEVEPLDDADYERIRHGWLCPVCELPMHERTNRKEGTLFFGCPAYPDCTGTRDTNGRPTGRAAKDAEWRRSGADPQDSWDSDDPFGWNAAQEFGYDGDG